MLVLCSRRLEVFLGPLFYIIHVEHVDIQHFRRNCGLKEILLLVNKSQVLVRQFKQLYYELENVFVILGALAFTQIYVVDLEKCLWRNPLESITLL